MAKEQGVTLIELIIVMGIAGIAASLAAPGFSRLINEQRVVTTANSLITSLQLARSEAARRGVRVSLCPTTDGVACSTNAPYEAGWMVFAGPAAETSTPYSGEVLQLTGPARAGTSITANGSMARYISYLPAGQTQQMGGGLQMGSLRICRQNIGRTVVINRAGRPRVEAEVCE